LPPAHLERFQGERDVRAHVTDQPGGDAPRDGLGLQPGGAARLQGRPLLLLRRSRPARDCAPDRHAEGRRLPPDGCVRLGGDARAVAGPRSEDPRRLLPDDGRARSLPDERGPPALPRVHAADPGRDPQRSVAVAVGQIAPARKRRRTQAERTALSEKLLLRAAVKLIARQGYSKTTLAECGREGGYSAGLVSHRFGSKEGLLRALIDGITRRFWHDQLVPAIEARSGLDALCAMADAYLGELTAREERLRGLYVLMGEALGPV